jgi:hypothetical protein
VATVRDRIKRAMRLIGAAATGETPSADELADGLTALNAMLSSWSLESLLVPSIVSGGVFVYWWPAKIFCRNAWRL